jgi:hypothetical protein
MEREDMDTGRADAGRADGVSTDDRAELVRLRRELVARMEVEILTLAGADFAQAVGAVPDVRKRPVTCDIAPGSRQGLFRIPPEQPLTCGSSVGLTGFEPATP